MAAQFRDRWGFRVFKLKGGVLAPEVERDSLNAMAERLGSEALLRIDPNGRWKTTTAIRIGKEIAKLPHGILRGSRCKARRRWPRSGRRPA